MGKWDSLGWPQNCCWVLSDLPSGLSGNWFKWLNASIERAPDPRDMWLLNSREYLVMQPRMVCSWIQTGFDFIFPSLWYWENMSNLWALADQPLHPSDQWWRKASYQKDPGSKGSGIVFGVKSTTLVAEFTLSSRIVPKPFHYAESIDSCAGHGSGLVIITCWSLLTRPAHF
jgi:hypothetical protein